jgi:hypothetical protein
MQRHRQAPDLASDNLETIISEPIDRDTKTIEKLLLNRLTDVQPDAVKAKNRRLGKKGGQARMALN